MRILFNIIKKRHTLRIAYTQEWTNSSLGIRLFGYAILLAHPIEHAKNDWSKSKCTSNQDRIRNIAFFIYHLTELVAFILNMFPSISTVFAMRLLLMHLKKWFSYFKTHPSEGFSRICWKHGTLHKIKFATHVVIIICINFSEQKILKNSNVQTFLIVVLMVGLWLKIKIEKFN